MGNAVCNDVSHDVRNAVSRDVQTRPDQTVVSKACGLSLVQFIVKAKERNARVPIGLAR